MASPRSAGGNQPITTRPDAAFTDAPKTPASSNSSPTATTPGTAAARASSAAAPKTPDMITIRSPYRSAAAPHAIRLSSTPATGAETIRLAENSDSPDACSAGTSMGMP